MVCTTIPSSLPGLPTGIIELKPQQKLVHDSQGCNTKLNVQI